MVVDIKVGKIIFEEVVKVNLVDYVFVVDGGDLGF